MGISDADKKAWTEQDEKDSKRKVCSSKLIVVEHGGHVFSVSKSDKQENFDNPRLSAL
jgi:hypothetical protein